MKLAIFVSGRGSNLQAIINSEKLIKRIKIVAVYSDKADCKAFEIAGKNNIPTYVIGKCVGCVQNEELANHLLNADVDLIVLAGYLRLIPVDVVTNFENRIINIHPALLPSFGGKGMYGINVHKAVFNSSCKISGATVHFVDNTYDTGKIIAQKCVDISDVKSPEQIAERILLIEHQILPEVIEAFLDNRIHKIDNRVVVDQKLNG